MSLTEHDEENLIEPGRSYPIWSPDQAFSAAAALLQALEEEKGQPWPRTGSPAHATTREAGS
jgi:hypothetical protein